MKIRAIKNGKFIGLILFLRSCKDIRRWWYTIRYHLCNIIAFLRVQLSDSLHKKWSFPLKLVSAIFIKFLFFHQMIALQKLWKMLFISSKKLFSFSRYSFFYFCSFLPVGHCFRASSKLNLKAHDVINCLNKNSITHFIRYLEKEKEYDIETLPIDGVSNKEHFCRDIMQKMWRKS